MANCSNCSQPLPEDVRFCIHCGQPVVVAPPLVQACPHCQAQLPGGLRFCVACGHDLKSPSPVSAPPVQAAPPVVPPAPVALVPPSGAVPRSAPSPSLRVVLAGGTALALLAVATYSYRAGVSPPSPSPPAVTRLSPTASATLEAVDLQALADTWSVDPGDPSYTSGPRERNELVLRLQGQEVSGMGPEQSPFRFWAEGQQIVGEARDPEGKLHKLRWEWLNSRQGARLHLLGESDKTSLILRRGPAAEPAPPTLYELQADLDGDGQRERAQVVALDRNPEPNASSRKVLRISDQAGVVKFESESFEEPFHTDLDSTAEHAEEKAGLHLLPDRRFPRLRIIFTTRSGNFVDFQFDGRQYVLAEMGD